MSPAPRGDPIRVRYFELAAPLHGHRGSPNQIPRLFRRVAQSLPSRRSHYSRDVDRVLEIVIVRLVRIKSAWLSIFRFPNSDVISRNKLDWVRTQCPLGNTLGFHFRQLMGMNCLPQWSAPHKLLLLVVPRARRRTNLPKSISPCHQQIQRFFYLHAPADERNPERPVDRTLLFRGCSSLRGHNKNCHENVTLILGFGLRNPVPAFMTRRLGPSNIRFSAECLGGIIS